MQNGHEGYVCPMSLMLQTLVEPLGIWMLNHALPTHSVVHMPNPGM